MVTDVPALEVRSLTKRYGGVTAVDGLSFRVPRGSVTGFLGPNGAGKTTTMRVLLGLARPTAGVTRVLGVPYRDLPDPVRRVGASLEITGFHPGRAAGNHLRVACLEAGLDRGRVDVALAAVGMETFADRRVGAFSAGMKQRLALATALLGEPEVLVLDEPANGLDPAGVAWLRGFLRHFASDGGAVLVSSHILSEVGEVADRVVVIHRGRLVTEGSVQEITGAAGESVIARSPQADRLAEAVARAGGVVVRDPDGSLVISALPIERVGEVAADGGITLHELTRRTSTLEEAFFQLTADVSPSVATGDGGP
jgi:ABC-2 type transport system ATP-binding protein